MTIHEAELIQKLKKECLRVKIQRNNYEQELIQRREALEQMQKVLPLMSKPKQRISEKALHVSMKIMPVEVICLSIATLLPN